MSTELIWNDRSRCVDSGFSCLFGSEEQTGSSRGSEMRRLITLIFAGRDRMVVIRRELPLTSIASPGRVGLVA
jgi:hypothetical protein